MVVRGVPAIFHRLGAPITSLCNEHFAKPGQKCNELPVVMALRK